MATRPLYALGTRAARRWPPTGRHWPRPWAARPGGHLHLRRYRGGQLGHLPGGPPGAASGQAHHHHRRGARGGAGTLQGPGGPGVPGHLPHPRPRRMVKVADLEAASAGHGAGVHDAGEQRDRGHQPVKEAGQCWRNAAVPRPSSTPTCHPRGFLKIPFTPKALGVDLLTVSGHKIGAMKGRGAASRRPRAVPLLRGGQGGPALRLWEPHPRSPPWPPPCLGKATALDFLNLSYPPEDLRLGGLPEGGAGAGGGGRRGCPPHLRHLPAGVPQPGGGALAQ